MKRVIILVLGFVMLTYGPAAFAGVVVAKSVASGTYEDGKFTPGDSSFEGEFFIDEAKRLITLDKAIEYNREGRPEEGITYEITNVQMSEGISALLVARNKKGQKIFTAVRESDLGASEVLMVGEDFYQYCQASNGKFYLEYGEVSGK